jgi:hypothetical protein
MRWVIVAHLAACSSPGPTTPAATPAATAGPTADRDDAGTAAAAPDTALHARAWCRKQREEITASLAVLTLNGTLHLGDIRLTAPVDQTAPPSVWLVASDHGSMYTISTDSELMASTPKTLGRTLDSAVAKHARPVVYRARRWDRLDQARLILRTLSARGAALVLVDRNDPALLSRAELDRAWLAIHEVALRCNFSVPWSTGNHRPSRLHRGDLVALAYRLAGCACSDAETVQTSLEQLADRPGLFVMTYDDHGTSLGRFAANASFKDVLRAASSLPLEERMRGVRF